MSTLTETEKIIIKRTYKKCSYYCQIMFRKWAFLLIFPFALYKYLNFLISNNLCFSIRLLRGLYIDDNPNISNRWLRDCILEQNKLFWSNNFNRIFYRPWKIFLSHLYSFKYSNIVNFFDGGWYRCITRDNINAHYWNIRQDWVSFETHFSFRLFRKLFRNFLLVRYLTIHLFDEPEITCQKIDKYLIYYRRLVYIVNLYKRNLKLVILVYFSLFCLYKQRKN